MLKLPAYSWRKSGCYWKNRINPLKPRIHKYISSQVSTRCKAQYGNFGPSTGFSERRTRTLSETSVSLLWNCRSVHLVIGLWLEGIMKLDWRLSICWTARLLTLEQTAGIALMLVSLMFKVHIITQKTSCSTVGIGRFFYLTSSNCVAVVELCIINLLLKHKVVKWCIINIDPYWCMPTYRLMYLIAS